MKQSDEELMKLNTELNNRQPPLQLLTLCTSVSLICLVWTCAPLSVYLSTVSPHDRSAPRHLQPELTCLWRWQPHSQLSLLSSTSWCSSMYCSCRVSESVSPPTPAVGDQPLLSDDAQSSPPSILASHPTVPFPTHTRMKPASFSFFFNSEINSNSAFSLPPLPLADAPPPPLFALHLHLPPFLLICL